MDVGLARAALDAHTDTRVYPVWHFCGGCMPVFGVLTILSAWNAMRGTARALPASGRIGVFYLLTGVLARWRTWANRSGARS